MNTFTYKLKGQVALRVYGKDGEKIVDHQEVVQAANEKEAIDLSLEEERFKDCEPVWEQGFTVERVYRFTFSDVYVVSYGRLYQEYIPAFTGTFEEMEAYMAEQTKGMVLDPRADGFVPSYTQEEPFERDLVAYRAQLLNSSKEKGNRKEI